MRLSTPRSPMTARTEFNVRSFRTTNVLRWEYRPGSVLFVAWQQGRDGFAGDRRFRFGDIFTPTPPTCFSSSSAEG